MRTSECYRTHSAHTRELKNWVFCTDNCGVICHSITSTFSFCSGLRSLIAVDPPMNDLGPNFLCVLCKIGCDSNVFVSDEAEFLQAPVAPNVLGYVSVLHLTTVCRRLGWISGPHTAAWLMPPSAPTFTGAVVDAGGGTTYTQLWWGGGCELQEGCCAFQHACDNCTRCFNPFWQNGAAAV